MKFLFVLDSVEAPQAVNPQLGRRLAAQLAAFGHTVQLLELWDGETPPPAPSAGVTMESIAFPDERRMNMALENGNKQGSPVPIRLLRLAKHPSAVGAAFRQLILHRPRRQTEAQKAIERLDAAAHFDVAVAVCAPYRAAFALEAANILARKALWQLDPYASNKEYAAPGGAEREAALLGNMYAAFITAQALPDYAEGPLVACRDKIHVLEFPCLMPHMAEDPDAEIVLAHAPQTMLCVFCGNLHPGIRSPEFAFKLFSALDLPTLELVMAGGGWQTYLNEAKAAQIAMGQRLTILGPITPERARDLLAKADVLLSIGNAVDNQIPSKIFEYFGFGKPILHLAATATDPVLPYLRRYPLGFSLSAAAGVSALNTAALQTWLEENAGNALSYAEVARLYPEYTPAAVAGKFLDVFL